MVIPLAAIKRLEVLSRISIVRGATNASGGTGVTLSINPSFRFTVNVIFSNVYALVAAL